MPVTPRNESEDQVPQERIRVGNVARRYEITVERECLSIKTHSGQGSRLHCPDCGSEVLAGSSSTGRKKPFLGSHSLLSILIGFLHFRRRRLP
jgi:hypothetical protein